MEKIIEIPEGYEARIEGNKVVIEPKESEDEKIRRFLITKIKMCESVYWHRNNPIMQEDVIAWLEKQKEQKPVEWSEEDKDYYDAIIAKLEITQDDALLTDNQINFLKSLSERFNLQPKQEWSEEDEGMINCVISTLCEESHGGRETNERMVSWLEKLRKSLRPQPEQEKPLEIKYAGKIYKVYGTKELPGGVVGYIIEDEPGHYDCIIYPDEVLGGGYGIKSNGSPYPTKEANFGQSHWKPSEEQMEALRISFEIGTANESWAMRILKSLYNDLKKLL